MVRTTLSRCFLSFPFQSLNKGPSSYVVEAVQALVGLGADTNARNNLTGATPLHMVAQSRKKEANVANRMQIVDLLVQHGANLEAVDTFGATPLDTLRAVVAQSDPTIAATLRPLEDKLQPQLPPLFQLFLEASSGDPATKHEAVRALIDEKGDGILQTEFQGQTPVECILDQLLDPEKTSVQDMGSYVALIQLCISHGARVSSLAEKKDVGEMNMDVIPETSIFRLVSAIRDEFSKTNDDGATDSSSGRLESLLQVVDLLVQQDDFAIDDDTIQLLHQAARRGQLQLAEFLVSRLKVDPNTKGRQGLTPLHFAARSGQVGILVRCCAAAAYVSVRLTHLCCCLLHIGISVTTTRHGQRSDGRPWEDGAGCCHGERPYGSDCAFRETHNSLGMVLITSIHRPSTTIG